MASSGIPSISDLCLENLNFLNNENLTLNAISKAFSALYIYDYFLTIGDEVKFAWKGRKTWLFSIYVLALMSCFRTVIVDQVFLVCITLFSQLFMTLKVYAVSKKNKLLTGALAVLMATQLIFGIFSWVWSIVNTPMETMTLPGCEGLYRSCTLGGDFQLAYTVLSLAFDIPAFMAILLFSHPWERDALMSTVHRTMCQDSTAYFLSVLSIQIFVTVAVSSGSVYPRALFPVITNVFIPLMVSRIVLSLRKAAYSQVHYDDWTVKNLTTVDAGEFLSEPHHGLQFRRRTRFSMNEE